MNNTLTDMRLAPNTETEHDCALLNGPRYLIYQLVAIGLGWLYAAFAAMPLRRHYQAAMPRQYFQRAIRY